MSDTTDDARADAKAKMREALDRKKKNEHASGDGRRETGAVHGSQLAPGGKRVFRRKSG